jgi:F0F1-type ATP synthase assembly protein I
MAQKPDSTMYQLGKYLGLAFLLPSGVVAGYLIGIFVEHFVHWSGCRAIGIVLGALGSMIRIFQELLRDMKRSERENNRR